MQILVSDLHRGDLGSTKVTNRFLLITHDEKATDMGVGSLCLSCQYASTDMQHGLLSQYVTLHDLNLRSNMDLTVHGYQAYVSTRLDKRKPVWGPNNVTSFLSWKATCKKQKQLVLLFLSLAPKSLMLAQIWWHASKRTSLELSGVFLSLLPKIISEIIAHFWRSMEFC